MLSLKHSSGQERHVAHVFVEDGERAVCIVLYSHETSKAVDAYRLESKDIFIALAEVRRWLRPRHLDPESRNDLLKWVRDEHETWMDVCTGRSTLPSWLGSRARRRIPQIEA